jgi:hypothetical protein
MSLWSRAFSCCIRARSHSKVGPHERTPLIPDTEHAPISTQPQGADQQKIKERLTNIVRSKEGKMVNVNAQIPFNLHNQKNLGQRFDPSSSRSLRSSSGGIHTSCSNQDSRRPSLSPATSLRASRSTASLTHPEDLSLETEPKKPILNVKLVRCPGRRRASSSRVRGRLGRFGEESGRDLCIGDDYSLSQGTRSTRSIDGQNADDGEDMKTPRPLGQWSLHSESPDQDLTLSSQPPVFKIQDAGVISRSWGD